MKHGSLFSGIGGFDLAAQWMGWENVFHCEKDEFCQKVLKKNFPNSILHTDIKELDGTIYRGAIDILTGGFPCQPFSLAGQRLGVNDARHLWPENLRIIKEIQPPWVVGENVYGIANWNKGMVFEMVCADLEAEGYEVQPVILPACSKNANHRRDRVWFIAYSHAKQRERSAVGLQPIIKDGHRFSDTTNCNSSSERSSGSGNRIAGSRRQNHDEPGEWREPTKLNIGCSSVLGASYWEQHWSKWPVKPRICGNNDGIPNRVDRIKSLGNAIVPQIAFEIFNVIEQMSHTIPLQTLK